MARITISLTDFIKAVLAKAAVVENRSISGQAQVAIEEHLIKRGYLTPVDTQADIKWPAMRERGEPR